MNMFAPMNVCVTRTAERDLPRVCLFRPDNCFSNVRKEKVVRVQRALGLFHFKFHGGGRSSFGDQRLRFSKGFFVMFCLFSHPQLPNLSRTDGIE